jgi:uncharacterized protein involved in exopolysaccharide biosynthesis
MVTELTPQSLVYVAFRQRRVILSFLLFGLVATVGYCVVATAQYAADASVVVSFNRQLTGTVGEQQGNNGPATPADADQIVTSYTLVLQSNALAEQVINEIGLAKMYPKYVQRGVLSTVIDGVTRALGMYKTPLERAVYHFVNKDIDVQVAKDSNVIQITLYNSNPDTATRALDVLISHFLENQARIGRDPQLAFVRSQVDVYRKQVASAQQAMEAFQLKNGISSMDEENSYLLKQRSDLEAQLAANKVQIAQDQNKIAALTQQLKSLTETVNLHQEDRDLALDAARAQLVELQVRQETLSTSFGADSPAARNIKGQIAKVEDFINSYPNRTPLRQMAPNPTYQVTQSALLQTQADLESAIKAQPVIQQQIDKLSARLAERSRDQSTYQDLVREYQIDDENYRNYLQAVQQARIADDLNKEKATAVAVYDPAHLESTLPAKPKKTLLIAAGILLGLVLGFTTAFLLETWDERLNTPRQVNAVLGLPLLGSMTNLTASPAAGHRSLP